MEVQDLLRKKRSAEILIGEAIKRTLKDFYNQTGFLIPSVRVDVEYQMVFGVKAPVRTNVTVRCSVDLETEGKDLPLLQTYGEIDSRPLGVRG